MASEVTIAISGMTCGTCSASITEALENTPGVKTAAISVVTEEGKISYDDRQISVQQLVQAVEDCGFGARVLSESRREYSTVVAIAGMTCGACSGSITEALESISGIHKVSVSLITEAGMVLHDSSVTPEAIVSAIEDCGFEATVQSSQQVSQGTQSKFAVSGMTCGSCSASITEALTNTPGVLAVSVSLLTEEALVTHDDSVSDEQIRQAIEDCGFDATLVSLSQSAEDTEESAIFQIFGLSAQTDTSQFQYNVEALLNSLGDAIVDFKLTIDTEFSETDSMEIPDSSLLQSLRRASTSSSDGFETHINELNITYDSALLGVRDLSEKLDALDPAVRYVLLNTASQTSNLQLKLLSKQKEISYWRFSFFKALVFGLPVMVISHTEHRHFWTSKLVFPGLFWSTLIQGILASYIQFVLGYTFIIKFKGFVQNSGKSANMDVLVCISTMISYIFSVFSIVISVWNGQTKTPPTVLFDTSVMIIIFISLGKWLENKAKGATSTALSRLISLSPPSCTIVSDMEKYDAFLKHVNSEKSDSVQESKEFPTKTIDFDLIQNGDVTIVLAGGKIPSDGEVVFGESEVDESLLTGEVLPVFKKPGDSVIGGSINGPGLIHVRVSSCGKNSQLSKIIKLVKDSQVSKAPIQAFSDYIASKFIIAVLILASSTFLFWVLYCVMFSNHLPSAFTNNVNGKFFLCLKIAISVVVVACPCALGLASPTAVMVGTGVGAEHGVLIKGGEVLEKTSSIDIILFDKTGTLTTGQMSLADYLVTKKLNPTTWWKLIGSLESNSEHPVGKALTKISRDQLGLFEGEEFGSTVLSFEVIPGLGVKGVITVDNNDYNVVVGNRKFLEQLNPNNEKLPEINSVNNVSYVLIDDQYYGHLELTDTLKPRAKEVIDYLRYHENYIVGIVSGDHHLVAESVGAKLGISSNNIFSEVTPATKNKIVSDLRERFGGPSKVNIAFVGDGINDAPALAQADIGIAISDGTDIAIESANIVIMSGDKKDLSGIPVALDISKRTFRRIKINFIWAGIYNMFMIPFAMGCFLPFNILLPPMAASFAMAFSSVSVVISSLLLKRWSNKSMRDFDSSKIDLESADEFDLRHSTQIDFELFKNRSGSKSIFNRNGYGLLPS